MTRNTHPLGLLDTKLGQRNAGLPRALATDALTTVTTVVLEGGRGREGGEGERGCGGEKKRGEREEGNNGIQTIHLHVHVDT